MPPRIVLQDLPTARAFDNVLYPGYWCADHQAIARRHQDFIHYQAQTLDIMVEGLTLHCPSGVYKPDLLSSTQLVMKAARLWCQPHPPRTILELAAGSGAIGLMLAQDGVAVTLSDICPQAVAAMSRNAHANRKTVEIVQSDLFDQLAGRRFDLIVCNLPLMDHPRTHDHELLLCDPGGELLARLLAALPHHLTPEGMALIACSNLGNREALAEGLRPYRHTIHMADYLGPYRYYRWALAVAPLPQVA